MNSIAKPCVALLTLIAVSLGLTNHSQAHDIAKEFHDAANMFLKSLDVLWRDFKNDFGEDSLRKHY